MVLCALGFVALLGAGCSISPQPEPPPDPDVDLGLLSVELDGSTQVLVGAPSAVSPGGSLLQTFDLHLLNVDDEVVVAEDGSFRLPLSGDPGDPYRIHVRDGQRFADPIEIVTPAATGAVTLREQYLGACFFLQPARTLVLEDQPVDTTATAPIVLDNQCADPVTVSLFNPRNGQNQITTEKASIPLTVEPGTAASVEVRFSPLEPGLHEDIVYLMIGSGDSTKRFVSVRGNGM